MKNRTQFLQKAIVRTFFTGLFYLAMPIVAKYYFEYVGGIYPGYTMLGSGVMILCSIILLIMSWVPVFDKEQRDNYNETFNKY